MSEQRFAAMRGLLALAGQHAWSWQLHQAEDGGEFWELRQLGGRPTGVFACGGALSGPAQAIAAMHPAVLRELGAAEAVCAQSLEHLKYLGLHLEYMQRRLYRLRQQEHYSAVNAALKQLADAIEALEGVTQGSQRLRKIASELP